MQSRTPPSTSASSSCALGPSRRGGRVIKTIGDEVMAIFPSADDAGATPRSRCRSAIAELPAGRHQPSLGVRIGLHYGPVVERDGDVFGDTVNLAARLSHDGRPRTRSSPRSTPSMRSTPMLKIDCRAPLRDPGEGQGEEIEICELIWQRTDDVTTLAAQRVDLSRRGRCCGWATAARDGRACPRSGRSLVLGRDATADLVIRERMASRAHCEIEQRHDKFVLTDHSANGTYVTIDGDREIVLRREEFTLRGHGCITLGQPRATATEVVEFFCE